MGCFPPTEIHPIHLFPSKGRMETVQDYKYQGVHLDNKPDRAKNTEAVREKGQNRGPVHAEVCRSSRVRTVNTNRMNKTWLCPGAGGAGLFGGGVRENIQYLTCYINQNMYNLFIDVYGTECRERQRKRESVVQSVSSAYLCAAICWSLLTRLETFILLWVLRSSLNTYEHPCTALFQISKTDASNWHLIICS